jgi:superfamily II DNA or RNA helicase
MVTKLMSTNVSYNEQVVTQIKLALEAGRKILVYSASLEHLRRMKSELDNTWNGRPMKTDFFIGGMSEEDLDEAATADVIFATYQMALDSLDIPALDTVVLASPIRNPEQPVGRILRPFAGKKDPVVVDIRADEIAVCKDYAESRDRTYIRLYEKK